MTKYRAVKRSDHWGTFKYHLQFLDDDARFLHFTWRFPFIYIGRSIWRYVPVGYTCEYAYECDSDIYHTEKTIRPDYKGVTDPNIELKTCKAYIDANPNIDRVFQQNRGHWDNLRAKSLVSAPSKIMMKNE